MRIRVELEVPDGKYCFLSSYMEEIDEDTVFHECRFYNDTTHTCLLYEQELESEVNKSGEAHPLKCTPCINAQAIG